MTKGEVKESIVFGRKGEREGKESNARQERQREGNGRRAKLGAPLFCYLLP
jgi:hypothetical protein